MHNSKGLFYHTCCGGFTSKVGSQIKHRTDGVAWSTYKE
jgi:hypothetical protein